MDFHLKDKIIIVTGSARGIGEAIALELVKEGAVPVIVDRLEVEANALAKKIKADGGNCLVIIQELAADEAGRNIIESTVNRFGRIDGIVNNAGINDGVGLEHGSPEAFKKSLYSNLTHCYDLVHYGLDYLKITKGIIINISSKTALTGQGGTSGYTASKGAQLALTREWATELLPYGIRVNAIVPAEVMTPMYKEWLHSFAHPDEKLNQIISRIPLGKRMTACEEIAAACVFLLSERSAHTTGQWLVVDGGYVHLDRAII